MIRYHAWKAWHRFRTWARERLDRMLDAMDEARNYDVGHGQGCQCEECSDERREDRTL